MSRTVTRSSAFIDTPGVNTHIPYTDGGYANISNVIVDIRYLGIDQVLDGISNGYAGSAPISSFITVAQSGVHFTLCLNATTTGGLQADIALVDEVNEAVPGCVTAVEGPYEINTVGPNPATTPIETLSDVSSVSLGLTDHPLIVAVEPNTVTTPQTDTISLNISEDAWEGDAEFMVKVNGREIGGMTGPPHCVPRGTPEPSR
jgi:hypothetical protein